MLAISHRVAHGEAFIGNGDETKRGYDATECVGLVDRLNLCNRVDECVISWRPAKSSLVVRTGSTSKNLDKLPSNELLAADVLHGDFQQIQRNEIMLEE